MKVAKYNLINGSTIEVEYDDNAPCRVCGEPVMEASVGGTDICPACDCGICRYCGVHIHPQEIKSHMEYHRSRKEL